MVVPVLVLRSGSPNAVARRKEACLLTLWPLLRNCFRKIHSIWTLTSSAKADVDLVGEALLGEGFGVDLVTLLEGAIFVGDLSVASLN